MKSPTGSELLASITGLLDNQAQGAQAAKQMKTVQLLSAFAQKYAIPPQSGAISALSRFLRKLDEDDIRQIRSMSDSLLVKEEADLREELISLRDQLKPIEAKAHQIKTRTAFIFTVLRPFSTRYSKSWFVDRIDIDGQELREVAELLERTKCKDLAEFFDWTRDVASLFEALVVYRGVDADDYYARPSGTVSEKSSRTYLQAWFAFVERYKNEIWMHATGEKSSSNSLRSQLLSESVEELDLDQGAGPTRLKVKASTVDRDSGTLSSFRESANKSVVTHTPKPNKAKSRSVMPDLIQIFIESRIDPTAQATRKWESHTDFRLSLQKWLDTLPVIWGSAADQFVAKVSVRTATGESDLTLPSLTVQDAAERLTKAVEMQQD
jgi:ribosomal protein L29